MDMFFTKPKLVSIRAPKKAAPKPVPKKVVAVAKAPKPEVAKAPVPVKLPEPVIVKAPVPVKLPEPVIVKAPEVVKHESPKKSNKSRKMIIKGGIKI